MFNKESLAAMTVIELRKLARENNVQLSAGISKQGIVERLCQALIKEEAAPDASAPQAVRESSQPAVEIKQPEAEGSPAAASPAPAIPARRVASIVTDDEDTPVLTPNVPFTRTLPKPGAAAPARPQTPAASLQRAAAPGASSPAPGQPAVNRGNIPGTNKPVFTLEGVRAWHNPRSYQQSGAAYGQRPVPAAPAAPRAPQGGVPYGQQRVPPRPFTTVTRFGPEAAQAPAAPEQTDAALRAQPFAAPGFSPQAEPAPVAFSPISRAQAPISPLTDAPVRRDAAAPFVPRDPVAAPAPVSAPAPASALPDLLAAGDVSDGEGVLETHPDGYGFLRVGNYLPGRGDIYVSNAQIRRFKLRDGDYIVGKTRPQRENDRYCALLFITEINGIVPEDIQDARPSFDALTAIYPKKRLRIAGSGAPFALRALDLFAPIGFGQRALIIAPPRCGKTALLRAAAASIHKSHKDAHIITLLLGERPEDITAAKEALPGEVAYAAFDEPSENALRVTDLALERAMRLAEQKKDAVLIVDDLSALVRAGVECAPPTSRTLPNGLMSGAMAKARRVLGAARCLREGGSLTVLAVLPCDAPGAPDSVLADEFRAHANAVWHLIYGRDARMRPALDPKNCFTRNAQLLQSEEEAQCAQALLDALKKAPGEDADAQLLAILEKTSDNADLVKRLPEWLDMLK